jgi:hypothetical protein
VIASGPDRLTGGQNWICPELKLGGSAVFEVVPLHANGTATLVAVLTAVNVEVGCLVGTFVFVGTLVSVGCTVLTGTLVGLLGLVGFGFRMGVLSPVVVAVECAIGTRV